MNVETVYGNQRRQQKQRSEQNAIELTRLCTSQAPHEYTSSSYVLETQQIYFLTCHTGVQQNAYVHRHIWNKIKAPLKIAPGANVNDEI